MVVLRGLHHGMQPKGRCLSCRDSRRTATLLKFVEIYKVRSRWNPRRREAGTLHLGPKLGAGGREGIVGMEGGMWLRDMEMSQQ